jgi:hypothetical protein
LDSYVVCENAQNQFHILCNPSGYVITENAQNRFYTMYFMPCRVWNLSSIPEYVFHAMSCVKSPIFRFHAIVFQAMVWYRINVFEDVIHTQSFFVWLHLKIIVWERKLGGELDYFFPKLICGRRTSQLCWMMFSSSITGDIQLLQMTQ